RERREGGFARVESPQPPQRLAEAFADEIVQRGGQRGPGGGILGQQLDKALLRDLQVERVVRQVRGEALQRRQDRVERLAVEGRRVRLPPAFHAVGVDRPHPGGLIPVGRAAGDG